MVHVNAFALLRKRIHCYVFVHDFSWIEQNVTCWHLRAIVMGWSVKASVIEALLFISLQYAFVVLTFKLVRDLR